MLSGAVDSGEVLDPLSLVCKTEKTIQCVIFVSTSKRQQAAKNCYYYTKTFIKLSFHFKFAESDEMDHLFGARIQLIVLFRSINLQIVRRFHVFSLIIS